MIGARDIARAAGARAHARRRLDHRADHLRMLAHAEIIVGAPDDDVALALRRMPVRVREPAGDALEIGKHAIAPLLAQRCQGSGENGIVVHRKAPETRRHWKYSRSIVESLYGGTR